MAISSAFSFLSDRKRPIVVSVFLFLLLSSLFLLFSPAPTALPFFSSPTSHVSSSSSPLAASPPPQTPISAPADPSPPETPADTSDGSNAGATPDRGTPASAVDVGGSGNTNETPGTGVSGGGAARVAVPSWGVCKVGKGVVAADYIPCLDNVKAVKALKSLRHMEHRERHCPKSPRCLVPLPPGYRSPLLWPRSRDMIWYNNVPHPKLVEYKKDQNWVRKSSNYFVFPGGGTQFKAGVTRYIQFIEQIMPNIQWGTHTRTVLDVGCGVASFGGYLLDRNVITMSVAPKDEHEAQIQFALERGIPALLAVIGTQKLPFPDDSFDVIHCARCGKPLLELNRVLRPGGYYIWSATPVYRRGKRDEDDWNAMVTLTKSICWRTVVKSKDVNKIGVVIYQKPTSNSCYLERKKNDPPLCSGREGSNSPWCTPLDSCLLLPAVSSSGEANSWPISWPERLNIKYSTTSDKSSSQLSQEKIDSDTKQWKDLVSEVYFSEFAVNWSTVRNVMDMNAGFGGFAASLIHQPLWVMNVVPFDHPETLPVIFNRGLIGVYHDWCESFNTYPRTYDLVHMSYLLQGLTNRCDIIEVAAEIDRILRPGKWFVLQDTEQVIRKMDTVLRSMHYKTAIVKQQFLFATKGFWRPDNAGSESR
uniref:Methyltransferase n=1 Tax=Leersia perrieri TaxID=77586 RepID=A0A0D9V7C8_9ORYZ